MTLIELNLPCVHIEELDCLTVAAKKCIPACGRDKSHIDHLIKVEAERAGLLKHKALVQRTFDCCVLL